MLEKNGNSVKYGVVTIVLVYIASNILVAGNALSNGMFTGGDFEGFGFDSVSLLLNLCVVVTVYLLSILLYFRLRRKSDAVSASDVDDQVLGWIVLGAQIGFLSFLTVGGITLQLLKTEASYATYFQALFVPDYLFLVYYPLGRRSKLFYPNLVLYLLSTLLRGLAGGFIFLILFELVFSFKRANWLLFKVAFLSLVLLSPFVYETRNLIRAAPTEYMLSTPATEMLSIILRNAYGDIHLLDALLDMTKAVFMRLAHLPSPVVIFDHLDEFWLGDANGRFLSFVFEGQPQATLLGKFLNDLPPLSQYITTTLFPNPYGSWFIHPSLVGWLWVDPFAFPVLIGYCVVLCMLNVFLVRKLGGRDFAVACSFILFVVLAMNGWFAAYISTTQALVILWAVRGGTRVLKRRVAYLVRPLNVAPTMSDR
jgi:hypothetical protein